MMLPCSHFHLVTSDLYPGDAIGNFVLCLYDRLLSNGADVTLYAERYHASLTGVQPYAAFFDKVNSQDILFYQLSNHDPEWPRLMATECRRVVYYHNITPGQHFAPYSVETATLLDAGRSELSHIASAHAVLANSAFSLAEVEGFVTAGTPCTVFPPFLSAQMEALGRPEQRPQSSSPYLLTLGRVVPHKRIEDALTIFRAVRQHLPQWTLRIVGAHYEPYVAALRQKLAEDSVLCASVSLTGALPPGEVRTALMGAGGLLHTSAHEGFCMPVLEAMMAGIPVFAHGQEAVTETLGGAGVLLDAAVPEQAALLLSRIINDSKRVRSITAEQFRRAEALCCLASEDRLFELLLA